MPHYRTVWISDLHLGSRGCQARELARFLARVRCHTLYLVGDVVDLIRLQRRFYWPTAHALILRRLLTLPRDGTRVVYVPGNHDHTVRAFAGSALGGIEVVRHAIHVTADERRLLVIHGDHLDHPGHASPFLRWAGDLAYEGVLWLDRLHHGRRRRRGLPYRSITPRLKGTIPSARAFIDAFERSSTAEAQQRQLDGVVCGHIHQANVRTGAVTYYNCGDWIESCTALVEHHDGQVELIGPASERIATQRCRAPKADSNIAV